MEDLHGPTNKEAYGDGGETLDFDYDDNIDLKGFVGFQATIEVK